MVALRRIGAVLICLLLFWSCDSPTDSRRNGPPPQVPQVGDIMTFNVQTESACDDPEFRGGRVRVVGETVIIVADTLNPEPGFSDLDYQRFVRTFDTEVRPMTDDLFGAPVDIDDTGRVIAFFTQEVNRLAASNDGGVVLGFFFARDLFPRERTAGATPDLGACEGSNEANLIYLRVPDPAGEVGTTQTLDQVERFTASTMAHEHQHLVNANRRLFVRAPGEQPFEVLWLNEGLSHITEELFFYRQSGLSSRSNLDVDDLRARGQPALDAFNRIQIINLGRIAEYMRNPSTSSVYDTEDGLEMRGASWHFLRYALDRKGGSDRALVDRLVNSTSRGMSNLREVLGEEPLDWMRDWSVALYADERVEEIPTEFMDRSWNHADFFKELGSGDGESLFPGFPIETHDLGDLGPTTLSIRGGGAAYLRFGVAGGSTAEVRTNSSAACPQDRRFSLAVGESARLSGQAAESFCVQAAGGDGEFVVVAFHAGDPDQDSSLTFETTDTRPIAGPPAPVAQRSPGRELHAHGLGPFREGVAPRIDHRFHHELMVRAERELTPLVRGAVGSGRWDLDDQRSLGTSNGPIPDELTLTVLRTL